jgi:hypothetical protein
MDLSTPFCKNIFARAMSAICGHHSLLDNFAIFFDKSNVAVVAPKFVFVVTINELVLVQEFFATIGTNEVFDIHFVYLTYMKFF